MNPYPAILFPSCLRPALNRSYSLYLSLKQDGRTGIPYVRIYEALI